MAYIFEKSGKLKEPTAEELAAADEDSAIIMLDQGILENGNPYWAYIAVKPSKYKAFKQITKQRKPMRLQDYGAILKHGFDKEVPLSIREEMRRDYGFDENYLAKLTEKVKTAQEEFLKAQENQRIGDIVAMLKKKQGE